MWFLRFWIWIFPILEHIGKIGGGTWLRRPCKLVLTWVTYTDICFKRGHNVRRRKYSMIKLFKMLHFWYYYLESVNICNRFFQRFPLLLINDWGETSKIWMLGKQNVTPSIIIKYSYTYKSKYKCKNKWPSTSMWEQGNRNLRPKRNIFFSFFCHIIN